MNTMPTIQGLVALCGRLHHLPPIGYALDPERRRFVPDKTYFPLVRRLFELVLSGVPVREVLRTANEDWDFKTPVHGAIGGRPLNRTHLYKLLSDPFYAGCVVWNGTVHPSVHQPIVSQNEFDEVRARLRKRRACPPMPLVPKANVVKRVC